MIPTKNDLPIMMHSRRTRIITTTTMKKKKKKFCRSSSNKVCLWCLCLLVLHCISNSYVASALEVQWTGNGHDDGPLPLSQKQRMELLQLSEAIYNSPNPDATLQQVAQSNQMDPNELKQILMRNQQDMMDAGGMDMNHSSIGRLSNSRLGSIMKFGSIVILQIVQLAKRYPQKFSMALSLILIIMYIAISAPRNGCPIGTNSFLMNPPRAYVADYLSNLNIAAKAMKVSRKEVTGCSRRLSNVVRSFNSNGITNEKCGRKSVENANLAYSITARKRIDLDCFDDGSGDDRDEEELEDELAYISAIAYEAALDVINSRRFSEYISIDQKYNTPLRFQGANSSSLNAAAKRKALSTLEKRSKLSPISNTNTECASLVMKKLAFRWGMQPLKLSYEEDEDDLGARGKAIAYQTIKGGHFDGELRFSIERTGLDCISEDSDDEEWDEHNENLSEGVVVSVSLVIPKKGRTLNKKLSEKLVATLSSSIATSIISEAKKKIARQRQSKSYRDKVSKFAKERRTLKAINEQKLEEMAADRKRRWIRKGGAGRYRPSGMRLEGSPRFGH